MLAAGSIPRMPELLAMLVACTGVALVCAKLGVAPLLGFLVAGVVIGPNVLALVPDDDLIEQMAEIGVVLLLFTIGIEFSLEKLQRIWRLIFVAGTLQVVGTVAVAAGLLGVFGVGWRSAVFSGMLLSLSSTAVVLKLLAARRRSGSPEGQAALGVLIFQALAVVVMVLAVPMLGAGVGAGVSAGVGAADAHGAHGAAAAHAAEAGGVLALGWALVKAAAIIAAVLILARRLVPPGIEWVARLCSPEVFLLTLIAVCFGLAWLTSLAGVSLALGAFLAGLLISESRFAHHAFGEVLPIQVLFSAVFFASVGMQLDPALLAERPVLILACVLGVLTLKTAVTAGAALAARASKRTAAAVGLWTAQVGEFAFVLEAVGAAAGLAFLGMDEGGSALFIGVSVLTMLATPLLAKLAERVARLPASRPARDTAAAHLPPVTAPADALPRVVIAGAGEHADTLLGLLRSLPCDVTFVTLNPDDGTRLSAVPAPAAGGAMHVHMGSNKRGDALRAAGLHDAAAVVIADDTPEDADAVLEVVMGELDRTPQTQRPMILVRTPEAEGADPACVKRLRRDAGLRRALAAVLLEYPAAHGLPVPPAEPAADAEADADTSGCTHTRMVRFEALDDAARVGLVCPACVLAGNTWVHLRRCATCGHIGCCDSSPGTHARRHMQAHNHPVIESLDRDNDPLGPGGWRYCYDDDVQLR